jgi:galactose-1-phosphate uridylyltransferase
LQRISYTGNLTESEKRKLRKQAKHYVSKENLLFYASAKGETRRVVRETEKFCVIPAPCIGSFRKKHIGFPNMLYTVIDPVKK